MKRFHVLDSFRGISAVSVVIFHIHAVSSVTEWGFIRNAYLFVPFFFTLSAFVLSHKYYSKNFDSIELKNMLNNRVFRLWPLHIAMLLVFLILEGGKLLAENKGIIFTYPAFGGDNAITEILPNLFLMQSWLNSYSDLSYNYPAWSISVEMGLYFILAAILFSIKALRSLVFALIAVITFVMLVKGIDHMRMHAFLGLFCFSLGVLTYRIYNKIKWIDIDSRVINGLEVTALILVFISLTMDYDSKYYVSTIVFCFTILVFSFENGVTSKILKLRPFTYLGEISYSIYMTHAAIIFCVTALFKILSKIGNVSLLETHPIENAGSNLMVSYFNTGNIVLNNGLVLSILVMVIATSGLTYRFIEQPGQKLGKKFASKRRDPNRYSLSKKMQEH